MNIKPKDIIFEDEHTIVINKPAGLLSIPDRHDSNRPNLKHILKKKFPDLRVVHRIDFNTSGLILFAKNEAAHKYYNQLFENRKIQKEYIALVQEHPPIESGTIDLPLLATKTIPPITVVDKKGKKAITHFKIKEKFKQFCLLQIKIETGRTHQIRAHLSYMNNPIVGDELYGGLSEFYLSSVKRKYNSKTDQDERPLISRQALHASSLSFIPFMEEAEITLNAELHKDMRATIAQLRKWNIYYPS